MKKALLLLGLVSFLAPSLAFADTSFLNLRQGARSEAVVELQTFLAQDKTIYPEGVVSGYFGSLTAKALARFQIKNGLAGVGYVGPRTSALLNTLMHPAAPSSTPPPGAEPMTPVTTTTPPVPAVIPPVPQPASTIPPAPQPAASSDVTPPSISYLSANSYYPTTATVIWQTNEPSTGKVYYGTTMPLDITSAMNAASTTLSIQHAIYLTGLSYYTSYYYIVESTDASGNTTRTATNYFVTSR